MERNFKIISKEDVKSIYDELAPWEKTDFLRELMESENYDPFEEIEIDEFIENFGESTILREMDKNAVVDSVFDSGNEFDVVDKIREDLLGDYIIDHCPDVL